MITFINIASAIISVFIGIALIALIFGHSASGKYIVCNQGNSACYGIDSYSIKDNCVIASNFIMCGNFTVRENK